HDHAPRHASGRGVSGVVLPHAGLDRRLHRLEERRHAGNLEPGERRHADRNQALADQGRGRIHQKTISDRRQTSYAGVSYGCARLSALTLSWINSSATTISTFHSDTGCTCPCSPK